MVTGKRSVNSLLEDLILEVFLRLPWKSLLRCRFVSKRFRDLIDSPVFLKRYDIFHYYVSDFALMHIVSGRLFSKEFHFSLVDSLNHYSNDDVEFSLPNKIILFLKRTSINPVFIGCCNGIVCLMVSPETETEAENYILFNPFNRTFHTVERRTNPSPLLNIESYSIGLGYDNATDDFKIMRMERVTKSDVQHIHVYSMRRNSWKQINGVFSTGSFAHFNGICVDGAIHWLWLNDVNAYSSIAAFDLKTEFMTVVPLPPHFQGQVLCLKDLGGRLSVFVKDNDRKLEPVIVWVIEKNGVDEVSWTWVMQIFKFVIEYLLFSNAGL